MNPNDTSSDVESTSRPAVAESLSYPGFVRVAVDRPIIELTWNKEEAEALPPPIPFAEGTCEC